MICRFDDLWASAADDGASSCPVGLFTVRSENDDEVEQLMNAWLRERSDRIESSLVLEQAHRLILDLLTEGEMNPRRVRQARHLIRAIRDLRKSDRDEL